MLLNQECKKELHGIPTVQGYKSDRTLQEYPYKNKRLKLEKELLRSFAQSMEGI